MFLFPHWALLGLQDEYRFGLFPFLMHFISAYTGRGLIVSFSYMCQNTLFLSTPPPFPFPNPFPTFDDNLLPQKHFFFFHVTSHTHTRAHTNMHTICLLSLVNSIPSSAQSVLLLYSYLITGITVPHLPSHTLMHLTNEHLCSVSSTRQWNWPPRSILRLLTSSSML